MTEAQSHSSEAGQGRSTTDNLKQLAEASKQLFAAGEQITNNLGELSHRVEHAADLGSQIAKSPWLIAAAAILGGVLILTFSRHRA